MIQPTVDGSVYPASRTTVGPKNVKAEFAATMQKKIAIHCQTRASRSEAMILCSRGPRATLSRARPASTSFFSSPVSHLALAGLSVKYRKVTTPARTDGTPSSRNIHCQPYQPFTPLRLVIIEPASGPPITPANADADMNSPKTRALRLEGYQ